MCLVMGMLTIGLLLTWGHVTPATAQCEPSYCNGAAKAKAAKAKNSKQLSAKNTKKPAVKDMYMRSAS